MAPRSPPEVSNSKIVKELRTAVRNIYASDERSKLTVNYARQVVEAKLGLGDGFLKEGDWKAKSKQVIFDALQEAEESEAERAKNTPPSPKGKGSGPSARNKPRPTKKARASSEGVSGNDEASDVEGAPARQIEKRKMKPAGKRKSKQPSEDSSDLSEPPDDISESKAPAKTEEASPGSVEDGESESDRDDISSAETDASSPRTKKPKAKTTTKPKPPPTEPATKSSDAAAADSSSELSSVIDEPAPTKRKRKGKDTAQSKRSRTTKSSSSAPSAGTAGLSPDEAQIKTLQTQLGKCGVRKAWAIEFKKRGADTAKAKIKLLKEMLVDVGMKGRFSEARAREIKEQRELQADLEDVVRGEQRWGVGGGGRGARRRAAAVAAAKGKGFRESGSESEEADESGKEESRGNAGNAGGRESEPDSDEEGGKPAVRGKGSVRRRADLAFLGDESESE
ncbi:9c90a151-a63e-47bc-bc9f-aad2c0871309 [Thermothielavioides terrestris]|uniref:9c90a151-a63e-47bc-bc9f-aad2c0871309 n=1 Tax=Thermothielavioides terrestris TaxID=2587410 RepID=A0A3S4ART6_9PEZI|nr:9c90a151-a63e-47bc-bc9f-aad2c0871309 [Thermothielavioides terrestris]